MTVAQAKPNPLLGPQDPLPAEVINAASDHPLLLVCEHAGKMVPNALNDLGIAQEDRDSHVFWDIGAEAVTRIMADSLGAPAILQPYSRLVIDCNRPPDAPDAMPEANHGVQVPGNRGLNDAARAARIAEIFDPFQATVERHLKRQPRKIVLSIHSFTPLLTGEPRPWHVGFLFRQDVQTSEHLARFIADAQPELTIGMNQPYQIDDASDWFVPQHGETSGLPHSLIEIRNDLIGDATGQQAWANILTGAVNRYLKEL
ncbi:N-formylglutamate amidohydrolase [Phaeobacter gallaeciensis]|jgi:predicted N-formylglutamate amidohydrolase|uniref:N-formylglutamate amidohydrolase n=1 Tax=Phaeobacter gallaeciensis TaxID=60890 RepID=UPI00237EECEC|nr:N-formylglutamate amidohydrolase [Phaeobacter gallaeciensis]MDE4063664.1 N-formylglutamate amidohydrolase [Phaeobacter gallaeciensis]MDE4126688.1 N-formylglutamate amidohydrolase [Phaeobacter gallaeciensis]MDE4131160.1 N-formylglutamate amidohydrolase [Phaeobacter gallaeciensis]